MLVARGYRIELDLRNPEDAARFQRLVHFAQDIQASLSTSEVVSVATQDALVDQDGEPVAIELEIGRAEWESAFEDLVATTIACCERALAQSREVAGVGLAEIDHVVLVGGSTRTPLVVRRVVQALCSGKSKCGRPLQEEVDTCVVLGAAAYAAQVGGLRLGEDGPQVLLTLPLVGRGDMLRLSASVERAARAKSPGPARRKPAGRSAVPVRDRRSQRRGRAAAAAEPAADQDVDARSPGGPAGRHPRAARTPLRRGDAPAGARAGGGARALGAHRPAGVAPPAGAEEIEALLAEAEQVVRALWEHDARMFRRQVEPLAAALREVVGTDPDKLAALASRLRRRVDEFRARDGGDLSPPLHRFEFVLDALRRVVYRAPGSLLSWDAPQWNTRISALEARAGGVGRRRPGRVEERVQRGAGAA